MIFTRYARVWDQKNKTHISVEVQIEIKPQAVADVMAAKAIKNKSGVSKIQGGIITARLTR